MNNNRFMVYLSVVCGLAAAPAFAQTATGGLQKDQPIQISSDKLDVFQADHKAIFTGNVIAVQGTSNLRAATMTVFYRDSTSNKPAKTESSDTATPVAAPDAPNAQGIYRINAETGVVFTTPTETATGDYGIYDVDADTIDLTGKEVVLTQGQNILKGTHVIHNMTTARSIMTSSSGAVTDVTRGNAGGVKPSRVQAVFVPKASGQ